MRGQLTFWILLALKDEPKYIAEIKDFILEATNGLVAADDKSMYRPLRRFAGADMISFTVEPNPNGPDRRVYNLEPIGQSVLDAFGGQCHKRRKLFHRRDPVHQKNIGLS